MTISPMSYLVTGASSGIGLALVQRLAASGHTVLATGRRPEAALPGDFPDVPYLAADLASPGGAAAVAARVPAGLDRAILNAGTGQYRPIEAETAADVAAILETNLIAPLRLAHALHPALEASRGRLCLVGSTAHRGAPAMPLYAASKGALDGLGRALASEWHGRVVVRVVHPGPTRTAMHARAGFDPGRLAAVFWDPGQAAEAVLAAVERGGGYRASLSLAAGLVGRLRRRRAAA
jgi:NAD(P)-dependent dehydrogenase (short-subunit alcohol dehydrogenase family)